MKSVLAAATLAAALLLAAFNPGSPAIAHDSNCDNTATDNSPIHCEKDASSTDDITIIDSDGVVISNTSDNQPGIKAVHAGGDATTSADITIDVAGTATERTISTTGANSHGIRADHSGTGDVDIDVENIAITTSSMGAGGIGAWHQGTGDVGIDVRDSTLNAHAYGIAAWANANLRIKALNTGIVTMQDAWSGITGQVTSGATGDLTIDLDDTTIATSGVGAPGVTANIADSGSGAIDIDIDGGSIATSGAGSGEAHGVVARHDGTGMMDLALGHTKSTEVRTSGDYSHGIYAQFGERFDDDFKDATSDLRIDVRGGSITTSGTFSHGVFGAAEGDSLKILLNNVEIETLGTGFIGAPPDDITLSMGVKAHHFGAGTLDNSGILVPGTGILDIDVRGGSITTAGKYSYGIDARHFGTGILDIDVQGSSITTTGDHGVGIYGRHLGASLDDTGNATTSFGTGHVEIDVWGGSIATSGEGAHGILARQGIGHGDVHVNVATHSGHSITTSGKGAHGILAYIEGTLDTSDQYRMDVTVGGPITVSYDAVNDDEAPWGVQVGLEDGGDWHVAATDPNQDVARRLRMQTVTVNGPIRKEGGWGGGVKLVGGGRVIIGPRGSIDSDSGIAIMATGSVYGHRDDEPANVNPRLRVDLNLGGRRVEQALHDNWIVTDMGGEITIAMNGVVLYDNVEGVTGATAPNGAWNVRMVEEGYTVAGHGAYGPDDQLDGDGNLLNSGFDIQSLPEGVIADRHFSADDFTYTRRPPPPPPPPPPPAPEPEMHRVDEPVVADASALAGVHVEGNGAVHIGAQGSLRAASGIAILATGDEPDLLVDMDLDGRQVGEVIGDDWIINDGGGTTIVVNGVTLHDGTTGVVPGASAPNGAREVQMQAQAATVRTVAQADADAVRIREAGVRVLDRTDPDPANWVVSEPAEGVIADRDFSAADFLSGQEGTAPQPPMFVEEYAPRAALYEALPDFLLRLTGPGPNRRCRSAPEEPAWVRFAGGQGAYDADRTTTGAHYTLDRFETEGGFSAALNDRIRGWVSVRHLWGTAGVGSPTGGGKIDVRGLGASVGGAWQSQTGAYALGCFAYMRYNVDFASTHRGLLKAGTNARANTLDVETGWRVPLTEQVHLTPRAWVVGSRVAVDRFTDAVAARVAYADAARIQGGLGVLADTTRPWGEGAVTVRGSVDLEKLLSGRETRVAVSGESLRATATAHSLLVGLNGVYRQGRFSIGAEVTARQELGSADSEYASFLNLGVRW